MQKVLRLSSLTYEWTQVTPSSALRSTTDKQIAAPCASTGMLSPSGKVLSTTYLGICAPPCAVLAGARICSETRSPVRNANRERYPDWPLWLPIFTGRAENAPGPVVRFVRFTGGRDSEDVANRCSIGRSARAGGAACCARAPPRRRRDVLVRPLRFHWR